MTERKKILVAMSGGVDSSVSAALLQAEGHEVAGATIRTWESGRCKNPSSRSCCGFAGMQDAGKVAHALGIPFWIFNFEESFRKGVMDYFAAEYARGRTPNPCIVCNEQIKFKLFFLKAKELGYTHMATGHYARVGYEPKENAFFIAEARDKTKDQSYVLFSLGREILNALVLPLGDLKKTEIRQKAGELDLCVKDKPESQEICFIPGDDYGKFLKEEYFDKKSPSLFRHTAGPGIIRTRDGKVLGRHEGYYHYTIGQRRGLGVAHSERLYVVGIYPETNEVVVGLRDEILGKRFEVSDLHWFLKPPHQDFRAEVKIRYLHKKAPARVTAKDTGGIAEVEFEKPQEAITPGQAAVFYDGERMMGGGWIDRVLD